jgi:hypothetical protein
VPKIKEFDLNGDVIYSAQFGDPAATFSYRAFKLDNWHAESAAPPKILASKQSLGETNVNMSWNGATEYDSLVLQAANAGQN